MTKHDETIACSVGINADVAYGAVAPPLHLSANYSFAGYGEKRKFDYSRTGNPTRETLAEALTELERGAGAVVTGSGMSAIDLVLSLLPANALVVAPHDCYGGAWRLFNARARRSDIRVLFIDQGDPGAVAEALAQKPSLLWIETPSNPLMRIVDVASLADRAHAVGSRVAVDNTFLSPALQKPLLLGADLVVHSTTKYINGHSDVVGGAVIAADQADVEQLAWWANCTGVTGAAFDAWLTLRGVRTLSVRIAQQEQSARTLAGWLERHPGVAKVHYPGLSSHAGHEIAKKQQFGFGAMLSFELRQGPPRAFVEGLRLITLAESLGGVESLIAHPASMTHAAMSAEARATAGISDALFRVSVGLEHVDDLVADLERALASTSRQAA